MRKISVTFILPAVTRNIIGGYKVIYEYANRLAADGNPVSIVYISCRRWSTRNLLVKVLHWGLYNAWRLLGVYQKVEWISLREGIREVSVPRLTGGNLPVADAYIATSVDTAYDLAETGRSSMRNSFYLVQGFESWGGNGEEYVYRSYRLPMNKIAVSYFLRDKIALCGESSEVIANGVELDKFFIRIPVETRRRYGITMLYHKDSLKGFAGSLSAVLTARESFPGITLKVFGSYERPKELPGWAEYYCRPDKETLCDIYNSSAVFVSASRSEGFGLTPAEAMACGCAVACTDIGGFRMFAFQDKTALLSPVGDNQALAGNIIRLISDDELRHRIARSGNELIQNFSWEKAYGHLMEYVLKTVSGGAV